MSRSLVLVDLLFFTGRKGGMESYVRELYSRYTEDDPDFAFAAFASTELVEAGAPWFPGSVIDSGLSGEDRVAWARGELFAVSRAARRVGAALIHAPANLGPARSAVPVVLTIHDLLPFRHPEYVPGPYAGVLRTMNRLAARAAARVLTVSESSADDIRRYLHVPDSRIDVVPLAGSASGATAPAKGSSRSGDLLLSVGNRMPHKNFPRLLEALATIRKPDRPRLVITGSHGDDPLRADVERLGLADHVELRGWVTADELDRLYRDATAYVFPTRFEGFGLPALEAMTRGCPLIASDLPVIREIAGDAAIYTDTTDAQALADAIVHVTGDAKLRQRMSRAGLDRASEFSWERTAAGTRRVFAEELATTAS
ncbi:glycosyltransferase [Agromyces sp. CFH 90414]|uniref:Glycosyltransferase n=1 Tax=Agromyces agglutinans TaxID=2662258 RepID=A0A6I2F8B9_9MICO|nr:glycosyltransferase family 1 protein [Agromyces agglutinans]MRG60571.1 glycosyltransferase [Agromyces agglutinans]